MTSFDAELDAIQKHQNDLDARYAQRMAKIELGKAQYQESLDKLKALGCSSVEEAQEIIASLEAEIQQELMSIQKDLDEDSNLS